MSNQRSILSQALITASIIWRLLMGVLSVRTKVNLLLLALRGAEQPPQTTNKVPTLTSTSMINSNNKKSLPVTLLTSMTCYRVELHRISLRQQLILTSSNSIKLLLRSRRSLLSSSRLPSLRRLRSIRSQSRLSLFNSINSRSHRKLNSFPTR